MKIIFYILGLLNYHVVSIRKKWIVSWVYDMVILTHDGMLISKPYDYKHHKLGSVLYIHPYYEEMDRYYSVKKANEYLNN